MSEATFNPVRRVKASKIILPAVIGLGVVAYMIFRDFSPEAFYEIKKTFSSMSIVWLLAAILCMIGRDLGYMMRIWLLSDYKLSWRQSFKVIMLWEFTSAVTPSAIGGTSVATFYVHKEGLSVGRSSAIVMTTSLLDEMYFVIMFPLIILIVGSSRLFDVDLPGWTAQGVITILWIGYFIKLVWAMLLSYGLFINPRGLSKLIFRLFHLPILRRWKRSAGKAAVDIEIASEEMKSRKLTYWLKAFAGTFLSWTSRYWVVNFMLLAFIPLNDHFLIFARQLVMWIAMLVSITPGGSGIAEITFNIFLNEFVVIVGLTSAMALLWRLISYYPYLVVGALLAPKWVNDKL